MYLTEDGLTQLNNVRENYPQILNNYQPELGNFEFSSDDLESKRNIVFDFLINETDFRLIVQHEYFYLTDWE